MLAPHPFPAVKVRAPGLATGRLELNRLFAAAVVNPQFRDELLNHPRSALANGYFGETFSLSDEEAALIMSHQARSLPELARHLSKALRS